MIGLDTNIVVRYLTQDDPAQSQRAAGIIERELTERNPGFISLVAMVEVVWVLDRVYGLNAAEIAKTVEHILATDVLVVQNEQEVFTATIALKQGRARFSDALIVALGETAGCSYTLTFDRKALRIPGVKLA